MAERRQVRLLLDPSERRQDQRDRHAEPMVGENHAAAERQRRHRTGRMGAGALQVALAPGECCGADQQAGQRQPRQRPGRIGLETLDPREGEGQHQHGHGGRQRRPAQRGAAPTAPGGIPRRRRRGRPAPPSPGTAGAFRAPRRRGSTARTTPSTMIGSPVGSQAGRFQSASTASARSAASQGSRSSAGRRHPAQQATGASSSTPACGSASSSDTHSTSPAAPSTAKGIQARRRPVAVSSAAAGSSARSSRAAAGTKSAGAQASAGPMIVLAISTQTAPRDRRGPAEPDPGGVAHHAERRRGHGQEIGEEAGQAGASVCTSAGVAKAPAMPTAATSGPCTRDKARPASAEPARRAKPTPSGTRS